MQPIASREEELELVVLLVGAPHHPSTKLMSKYVATTVDQEPSSPALMDVCEFCVQICRECCLKQRRPKLHLNLANKLQTEQVNKMIQEISCVEGISHGGDAGLLPSTV